MGKKGIYIGGLITVVLIMIAYASYGMLNKGQKETIYPVSVIVDNSSSDRWFAFREGLKQAAGDYHVQLNMVSTGAIADLEEEKMLIERERENGAKGIIVQMCDDGGEEIFTQMQESVGGDDILLVETDVEPEGVFPAVIPDNYEMGRMLAESMKKDIKELHGKKIGILLGRQEKTSQKQRLKGFMDEMEDTGATVLWEIAEADDLQSALTAKQLEETEILVALDNDETEQAVDYLIETETRARPLYGVGCSEKNVYYLDRKVISVLIVPNEFHMGYQSVAIMAERLKDHITSPQNFVVSFLVVRPETLYEEDNQKLLFPLVQ